jgi:hypothetical protein
LGQRLQARRRARTGSHLPHPNLKVFRQARWEHTFDRPTEIYLDGQTAGRHRQIAVWLRPDCFRLFA